MKKDFILPVLVLVAICLVISTALAFINNATEPVIVAAAAARAEAARSEVIPDASGFERLDIDGLPKTVTEVYKASDDLGYIFMLTTKGYGGELKLICGIDNDGKIIACRTLEQTETKGLGSRVAEAPFESQFVGVDESLDGVSAISGATISSSAYINAVQDAFTAFERVKEAA